MTENPCCLMFPHSDIYVNYMRHMYASSVNVCTPSMYVLANVCAYVYMCICGYVVKYDEPETAQAMLRKGYQLSVEPAFAGR
jgi:hypothetical protein